MKCVACGTDCISLHTHHVVPLSAGGKDVEGNTLDICEACHSKIHDLDFTGSSELTKLGLQKTVYLGEHVEVWYEENKDEIVKLIMDYQDEIDNHCITECLDAGFMDMKLLYCAWSGIKWKRNLSGIDLRIYTSFNKFCEINRDSYSFK